MSRALLKKSLALVKSEAGKGSDGEEIVGSKKKSVRFQREREVEGDRKVGKKKKQKRVRSTTPTTTEGNSIPFSSEHLMSGSSICSVFSH